MSNRFGLRSIEKPCGKQPFREIATPDFVSKCTNRACCLVEAIVVKSLQNPAWLFRGKVVSHMVEKSIDNPNFIFCQSVPNLHLGGMSTFPKKTSNEPHASRISHVVVFCTPYLQYFYLCGALWALSKALKRRHTGGGRCPYSICYVCDGSKRAVRDGEGLAAYCYKENVMLHLVRSESHLASWSMWETAFARLTPTPDWASPLTKITCCLACMTLR